MERRDTDGRGNNNRGVYEGHRSHLFKIQGEVPSQTIWPQVVDAADMVIMTVGDEGGVKVI